jgi:myo-inositol-1(or 4)-monophosphatase
MASFNALFTQVADIRRAGSAALDLAYVAAGRLDGYWEIGLQNWDLAAGLLLVEEAGGLVTDFAGRDELFNKGNVVAAGFGVHKLMLKAIEPHLPEPLK